MSLNVNAGQIDPRILAAAYEAIKDGDVSRRDVKKVSEAVQEATGGTVSEDVKAFIANLDDPQLQSAIKEAVQKKGLFRSYEFNQNVSFSLNQDDNTLAVGNNQITREVSVDDALQGRTPERRLGDRHEHRFARDSDRVRDRIAERMSAEASTLPEGPNVGINSILSAADDGVADVLQSALSAEGEDGNYTKVELTPENLKLNEGINLPVALLLSHASKLKQVTDSNSKNNNREIHDLTVDLKDLTKILNHYQKGNKPDASDLETLSKFGLAVKDGQIINKGTSQTLTPDQVIKLRDASKATETSFTGFRVLDENKIALQVIGQLKITDQALRELDQAQQNYLQAEQNVRTNQTQVDQTTAELNTQTNVVETHRQQVEQESQTYQTLLDMFSTSGRFNLDEIRSRLAAAKPENIAKINELLAKHGLQIESNAGAIRFRSQGQSIEAGQFFSQLQPIMANLKDELKAKRDELQQEINQLEALGRELKDKQEALQESVSQLDKAKTHYQTCKDRARVETDKLKEMRNDPEVQKLAPDLLAQMDQTLQNGDQAYREYDEDMSRYDALVASTHETLSRAEQAQQLRRAMGQGALLALENLDQIINLDPFESIENEQQAEVDRIVGDLINEANELASQLELLPKPVYTGIENIEAQFQDILARTIARFEELDQEQSSQRDMNMRLSSEHLKKITEELKYHSAQLEKMDLVNKEQKAIAIQQGLAAILRAQQELAN